MKAAIVRILAWGALLLTAGCSAGRGAVPDPYQLAWPLPVSRSQAWAGIVKTLLLQGEVIESAQSPVGRVTFRRPLSADTMRTLCDVSTPTAVDIDSWRFLSGHLDLAVWLEGDGRKQTTLKMEGRCWAKFEPPRWHTWLLMGPQAIILGPLIGPSLEPTLVVFRSSGKAEKELENKIATLVGVGLPAWLINKD